MEAHVLATWADREPAAAASWVKDIPGKSSPANLMAVLGAWTDTDQASAMDWYLKELDSTQRQSIFADMLVTARERELVQRLLENIDPVAADDGLNAASRSLQDCDPDMSRMLAEFLRKPMMGREQDTLEFSDKDFAPIEDPVPSEISESTAEPTLPES